MSDEVPENRSAGARTSETVSRKSVRRDADAPPRVVLVNVPFASFRQPSLALGLLKASLGPVGAPVTVLDATLLFAEMIGPELYDMVATWRPEDLLGDWVFAPAISRPSRRPAEDYQAQVLAGGTPEHDIPHFGKMPLTPAVRDELHDARHRTAELLERCLADVVEARPAVVGFTSMFHQHAASLALAERVKGALPDACVVFGGASCRGETGVELLRQFPFVDAVAIGEGEMVLPELVRRRARGERIDGVPGLVTHGDVIGVGGCGVAGGSGGGQTPVPVDLDALPAPDFGDYFTRLERSSLKGAFVPRLPFETSRGCWWGQQRRCVFCGQASDSLAYRRKSNAHAIAELEELTSRHPSLPLVVTDEIVSPRAFRDFFPLLPARVPGLEVLYLEVRPGISKDHLRVLAEAGVRRLEAGVESLSTPVLKLMRKGTTALQGVELLKWARELGVEVVWNYLWGLPGEDPEEYERAAALVPLIAHLQPPNSVGVVRLDRFSPLFEDPASFGIDGVRPYPAYGYVYDLPVEALGRLAYYFTFERSASGRGGALDVGAYTARLAESIARWKQEHAASMLAFVEDGERLVVFERRPGFDSDELTVLDGEHRLLYLACDGVRDAAGLAGDVSAVRGGAVSPAEVEELLAPLLEQGLMLREGSSYLSLALRAPRAPAGRPR